MKRILSFIILLSVLFQSSLSAAFIDERKNDIYFANGVLNERWEAQSSLDDIIMKAVMKDIYSNDEAAMLLETDFKLAYNQSAHVLDFIEVIDQNTDECVKPIIYTFKRKTLRLNV